MITEDHVSFEIAKLLKEKGFDELCIKKYKDGLLQNAGSIIEEWQNSELDGDEFSAPTHQMALKWLREVHNIHIEIYRTACGYLYIISNIPYGTDLYNPEYGGDDENSGQWTTYEKAVEAALLYVLKNLI